MPVTPESSPSYELGYLYQMGAIYISAVLFIAIDSVALCMIMFGCAQLEIVMDKLQQVHTDTTIANPAIEMNETNKMIVITQ